MMLRGLTLSFILIFLTACGGGSSSNNDESIIQEDAPVEPGTDIEQPESENQQFSDEVGNSYIPSEPSKLLLFDTVDDSRIMRWRTDSSYLATLYGSKSPSGEIEEFKNITIENQEGDYVVISEPESEPGIVMLTPSAIYSITTDPNGELIYRIDVDDQFVEFAIDSKKTSLNAEVSDRKINPYQYRNASRLAETNVLISGCPADVKSVYVDAFDRRGSYIDTFRSFKEDDGIYSVPLHGLSNTEEAIGDFAEKIVTFLKSYDFFSLAGNAASSSLDDVLLSDYEERAEQLIVRRVSERVDKIKVLKDLDTYAVGEVPSLFVDELKISALKGLGTLLKFVGKASNLYDWIEKATQAGEIVAAAYNLASVIQFDQVSFKVTIFRFESKPIEIERTDLYPADSSFPSLTAHVPCVSSCDSELFSNANPLRISDNGIQTLLVGFDRTIKPFHIIETTLGTEEIPVYTNGAKGNYIGLCIDNGKIRTYSENTTTVQSQTSSDGNTSYSGYDSYSVDVTQTNGQFIARARYSKTSSSDNALTGQSQSFEHTVTTTYNLCSGETNVSDNYGEISPSSRGNALGRVVKADLLECPVDGFLDRRSGSVDGFSNSHSFRYTD